MVMLGSISSAFAQGESGLQATLKAFEDKPGYVQPLATWFGTFANQGWVTSARVNAGFGWEFAMPVVGLGFLSDDDHTYTSDFDDGCAAVRAAGISCPSKSYTVPTIVGPNTNTQYTRYDLDPINANSVVVTSGGSADDGDEDLRQITTLGTTWLQASFSYQHTKLTLRALPLWWLSASEFAGYNHLGFGLQYDLGHLFAHKLPPGAPPVDVSLTTNYNFISLGVAPSDYNGELNLDFTTMWHALVVGTRLGRHFEIFSELGYETSTMKSSGSLVPKDPEEESVAPKVEVDGRNGFKASINFALHFDTYHPVIGMSQGAQTGVNVNILNFGKEGNP